MNSCHASNGMRKVRRSLRLLRPEMSTALSWPSVTRSWMWSTWQPILLAHSKGYIAVRPGKSSEGNSSCLISPSIAFISEARLRIACFQFPSPHGQVFFPARLQYLQAFLHPLDRPLQMRRLRHLFGRIDQDDGGFVKVHLIPPSFSTKFDKRLHGDVRHPLQGHALYPDLEVLQVG